MGKKERVGITFIHWSTHGLCFLSRVTTREVSSNLPGSFEPSYSEIYVGGERKLIDWVKSEDRLVLKSSLTIKGEYLIWTKYVGGGGVCVCLFYREERVVVRLKIVSPLQVMDNQVTHILYFSLIPTYILPYLPTYPSSYLLFNLVP